MGRMDSATARAVDRWARDDPDITGTTIAGTDAILHTESDTGVDWAAIHAESVAEDATVASMAGPYWANGRPVTVLAFWGAPERARIAADLDTPHQLAALLANDPDSIVAHLAAARLPPSARPGFRAPSASWTTQSDTASTTSDVPRLSDLGRDMPRNTRSGKPVSAVFATLAVIAAIAGTTFAVAMSTATRWTAIDVPQQAETFRDEAYYTGKWIVCDGYDGASVVFRNVRTITPGELFPGQKRTELITCGNTSKGSKQLCHSGQDWTDCINAKVDEYNRECTRSPLTGNSLSLCKDYKKHINWMKKDDRPGWIVETVGDYGYLRSVVEIDFRQVTNNDYRPAVTHQAICYLRTFGECPQSGNDSENR